jgi:hypothetical protein
MKQEHLEVRSAPPGSSSTDTREPCQEAKDHAARMIARMPPPTPEQCRTIANILNW